MEPITEWWGALTPGEQVMLRDVVVAMFALIAGWLGGGVARGALTTRRADRYLLEDGDGDAFPVTRACIWLARLAGWGAGVWALAALHEAAWLSGAVSTLARQVGAIAAAGLAALFMGRWLMKVAWSLVNTPPIRARIDAAMGLEARHSRDVWELARPALRAALYTGPLLAALLVTSDIAGLSRLGAAAAGAWSLGLKLAAVALAAVFAWRGLASIGDAAAEESDGDRRARVLYGAVLLVAAALFIGESFTTAVVLLLTAMIVMSPLRGYAVDLWAMLYLLDTRPIEIGGTERKIAEVGPFRSSLEGPDGREFFRNRDLVRARLDASAQVVAPSYMVKDDPPAESPAGTPAREFPPDPFLPPKKRDGPGA